MSKPLPRGLRRHPPPPPGPPAPWRSRKNWRMFSIKSRMACMVAAAETAVRVSFVKATKSAMLRCSVPRDVAIFRTTVATCSAAGGAFFFAEACHHARTGVGE